MQRCTGCSRKLGAKSNPTVADNNGQLWHKKCLEFSVYMRTHGDAFKGNV